MISIALKNPRLHQVGLEKKSAFLKTWATQKSHKNVGIPASSAFAALEIQLAASIIGFSRRFDGMAYWLACSFKEESEHSFQQIGENTLRNVSTMFQISLLSNLKWLSPSLFDLVMTGFGYDLLLFKVTLPSLVAEKKNRRVSWSIDMAVI